MIEGIFVPLSHLQIDGARGVELNNRVRKDLFLFIFLCNIYTNFNVEH